jgi:aspartyl-tRNA(Asn)/glutamyl-tRNA(Gln) amidotransferase subunit C
MSLSPEEVRKVAQLARLHLTAAEEERFTTQLSNILDYIEQLNELDVEGVEPTTRAIDVSNIMRDDQLESCPDREALLNCAPDRDEDFFKVPKILG